MAEVALPHTGHVCDEQTAMAAWVKALVSKAGGVVVLEDELLAMSQFLPLEIERDEDPGGWLMRLVGQPFGAVEGEDGHGPLTA